MQKYMVMNTNLIELYTTISNMIITQSEYEKFQEWLNECPVEWSDYRDNIDRITITFETTNQWSEG